MRILYQINSLETVYAARFIYEGYKDAFLELGYEFRPYTASDNLEVILDEYNPDIFITSLNEYNLMYLNLDLLRKYRNRGLVMFTQISPWKRQNNQFGGGGLGEKKDLIDLI